MQNAKFQVLKFTQHYQEKIAEELDLRLLNMKEKKFEWKSWPTCNLDTGKSLLWKDGGPAA